MDTASGCLACALEELTNNPNHYEAEQHTCKIGTETGSGSKGSASAYTLDNYQQDTGLTAIYPHSGSGNEDAANYCILGLIGEAGEIANKFKKLYRDAPNFATHPAEYYDFYAKLREDLFKELGDGLWYTSQLATELGATLGSVAADNIRKLNSRKERGKLHGSGDER